MTRGSGAEPVRGEPRANGGEESGREPARPEHLAPEGRLRLDERVVRVREDSYVDVATRFGRDRLEAAHREPRRNVLVEPAVQPEHRDLRRLDPRRGIDAAPPAARDLGV